MKKITVVMALLLLALPVLAGEDAKEAKEESYWNWAMGNKELAQELDGVYKEHPDWKSDKAGDSKADALKMFALLQAAEKHPKLTESMLEWADNHPGKAEWLFKHPLAATWLMKHPGAAKFLEKHPGAAARFARGVEFAKWMEKHPELKKKAAEWTNKHGALLEKAGEKREERGEKFEEKGENMKGKKGDLLEKKGERMQNQGERMQNRGERQQKAGHKK